MYWRYSNKEYNDSKPNDRKIALKIIVDDEPHIPGLLAYIDDNPVGWIALSPRSSFNRLSKSRVIPKIDGTNVWSIVCFFIHKSHRGIGVSSQLIGGAIDYAKTNKIKILEVYPIDAKGNSIDVNSSYVGIVSMFDKLEFEIISTTKSKGGGRPKVIMRKIFKS